MNPNTDTHLTYDEQLMSLVDPSDLDAGQQAHLQSCSQCQQQAHKMSARFERMGQLARQLAPEPSLPFRLQTGVPRQRMGWRFKPAWAAGMIGVLVMVFTLWGPGGRFNPTQTSPEQLALETEADALFMAEIDELVNDALPKVYRELAMVDDADTPQLSDDLIDWIVPIIEEDEEPIDPRA